MSREGSPTVLPAPALFTSLLDDNLPAWPPGRPSEGSTDTSAWRSSGRSSEQLCFSYRDGDFSDCEVVLGERTFRLHRQLLAKGPRRCGFFEGAFREGGFGKDSSAVDLSTLLPEPCHMHFDVALDFVYGEEVSISADSAAYLYKIGDVLQGEALMRASLNAMDQHYLECPGWRTASFFLDAGTQLECDGVVSTFLPRVVRIGMPRDVSEPLLVTACQRFPALAASLLAELSEGSGWRWDPSSVTARPAETCTVSHAQATFAAEGAARLLPDIEGVRACALVAVGIKCSGPTIGVSTASCDLLSQRHADGGFARVAGGWGLSLSSGTLWAEGRRAGQVPSEHRNCLVGTRISMRLDASGGMLTFSAPGWSTSIQADFGTGPGLRFTVYACCGGTAYALA